MLYLAFFNQLYFIAWFPVLEQPSISFECQFAKDSVLGTIIEERL